MGEMVASRSMQMLLHLAGKHKYASGLVEDEVKELVLLLGKIEKLLINDGNSRKVTENIRNIRNLVYTIEDALETLAVKVEEVEFMASKNEKKRGITRLLRRHFGRGDEGSRIIYVMIMFVMKSNLEGQPLIMWLHDTFPEVFESEGCAVLDSSLAHRKSLQQPRLMYTHDMEDHFVEMKEDLEELVELVADQDKQHRVVSIYGVKGLGKTNLARRVYIDRKVRNHFNAFAWVSLNQDYQIDDLLQNILNQLDAGALNESAEDKMKVSEEKLKTVKTSVEEQEKGVEEKKEGAEEQSQSSEETVVDQLKKILRNQRCFIVIDDVSESSQWDYIRSGFVIEGGDTKFLLTTENKEIASGVGLSHELRCLNEDEGWELLQKYAFRGKKAPDLGLIPKLGKEMVRQCGGLPSEISRLGRTLSKMYSFSEWYKVNDDVAGYLQRTAEQSEWNERHDEQSDPISYDRLTYGGKQCFLYLAMFKEDEGVDPEDLSFLWMAEGMVSTDHQLEKTTTEYYLQELASMLHVQVDELSTNMRFISLSLRHDLREWSLYLGDKEDFRLKVVDISRGKQPRFDRYTLSDGTRRLVIHFNKLSSPVEPDLNATENLRSLLFLNSDMEYVNLPVKISDFSDFLLLRVLHFVRCKFEGRKLPEGIWKLLNLSYFGVLYCDLDELPPSIANFRNLQVLNVRSYDDCKIVIPNVISQMVSLKHVRLPHNSNYEQQSDKLKLDGLLDLESLDGFNADIHDLDSLSKLEKLRDVVIHAYSSGSLEPIIQFVKSHGAPIRINLFIKNRCDLTSPKGMTVLEEVLMCPNLHTLTFSMARIHNFPNCGMFGSKQLTQIKLIGCKLREDPMEALGKFPNLSKLWLGYGAFVGKKMAIRDGGFPNLEYLEFRCLPNLEEWNVDNVAMKKLSTLIVRKCPELKGIPDELASLTSLKNMEIELSRTALAEGWDKIYMEKFGFVKNLSIRKLGPSRRSSAH